MKCANCGQDNPDGMRFCGHCGSELAPPAVTPDAPRNRHCVSCGRAIGWDANACQYCGHDYRKKKGEEARESATNSLLVGAVCSILAGIISIVLVMVINMDGSGPSDEELVVSSMMYLFAILAVIGGLSSLAKVSYPMSVLGAACGIFGPGFFFGVPALVLTSKSAQAFEEAEAG